MQIGPPLEVYNQPQNRFVADFIGSPSMNFINVRVHAENDRLVLKNEHLKLSVPENRRDRYRPALSEASVVLGIRPQHIYEPWAQGALAHGEPLKARVEVIEPVGPEVILLTSCGHDPVTICVDPKISATRHAEMEFLVDMDSVHLFHQQTGEVY